MNRPRSLLLYLAISCLRYRRTCCAFSIGKTCSTRFADRKTAHFRLVTMRASESDDSGTLISSSYVSLLRECQGTASNGEANPLLLNFTMKQHRPLGCTIEESLVDGKAGEGNSFDTSDERQSHDAPYVFISSIKPDGLARAAGLQQGDVIVGVTGLFGELQDVTRAGLEKIQGLVASCPDDEPLQLQVVRGTTVQQEHEKMLVELCTQMSTEEEQTDLCLLDYLKNGYTIELSDDEPNALGNGDASITEHSDDADADTDRLIDSLYGMWDDGLSVPSSDDNETQVKDSKQTPGDLQPKSSKQPWSSRSSPSGTYVRDPLTGEMKNLDSPY